MILHENPSAVAIVTMGETLLGEMMARAEVPAEDGHMPHVMWGSPLGQAIALMEAIETHWREMESLVGRSRHGTVARYQKPKSCRCRLCSKAAVARRTRQEAAKKLAKLEAS
jgi:hypothetical protein